MAERSPAQPTASAAASKVRSTEQTVFIDVGAKRIDANVVRFVAGNPQVNRIVGRAAAGPLSAEDEQAVVELFRNQDVAVTDEPGRDVTAAVEALRVLTAFGR
ncbi:MAG: hypothetical protein LC635_00565 [Pseudonocardiaceae bacterium]|nr:hypothetical protein [Pseudonocardiaceae bacterium]